MTDALRLAQQDVLLYLFNHYREAPGNFFPIDATCKEHFLDPLEMGRFLEAQELVLLQLEAGDAACYCAITPAGINEIYPDYFTEHLAVVMLAAAHSTEAWIDVQQASGLDHFVKVHDLGKVMDLTRFFEVMFEDRTVRARLTPEGRDYYLEHREGLQQ